MTAAEVFAHARNGDVERAAALVAEIVEAEPLWRAAFERYERLDLLPEGVVVTRRGGRIETCRTHSTSRGMPRLTR